MNYKDSYKKDKRLWEDLKKCTYKCTCGHSVVITNRRDGAICSWCGHTVLNEKGKFKVNLKKKLEEMK